MLTGRQLLFNNLQNQVINGKYDWKNGYIPDIQSSQVQQLGRYVASGKIDEFSSYIKGVSQGILNDATFLVVVTPQNQNVFGLYIRSLIISGANFYFTNGQLDHILQFSNQDLDITKQVIDFLNLTGDYKSVDPDLLRRRGLTLVFNQWKAQYSYLNLPDRK